MYKSIKIRLYPDADQTIELNKMLGSFRFVYNKCLDRKITSYKESNISETEKTLYHYINDLKKTEEYAWLVEINTLIQHKAIQQMLGAFDNFYKHHKGFPNFKSKHENKITCKIEAGVISKRNDYSTRKLTLTKKIKDVKFRCSDKYIKILCENKIKSATLIKTCSGNYFLSLVVDFGDIDLKLPTVKNKIGIDLGVKDFIVTSDNKIFENQHFNKSKTKRIKRLQRQLSKKQKGSNNRNKIRIKLARIYEHITNRKTNFLHNITTQLVNENQVICIEDLNVKRYVTES